MPLDESAGGNRSSQRQILGVCWVVYGIFRLILGVCLVLFGGTATVMFGALLGRVPNPFALMADFHVVYAGMIVLTILCGIFGILAGLALLANQGTARVLALIAALCRSVKSRLEPPWGFIPWSSCCRYAVFLRQSILEEAPGTSVDNKWFRGGNKVKPSTNNEIAGRVHEVKGKIKQKVGQLTNDRRLEAKGVVENIGGRIQKKIGQVQRAAKKV